MVKRMIVVLSAMALVITAVGAACAQMENAMLATGNMIMIPMKVKYTFTKNTRGTLGGDSVLFMPGSCEQYTAGFRPWGVWRSTSCSMKVQVIPPKCVGPAYGGPVSWGAPPPLPPNSKLVSNLEKFEVISPGCNPCAKGGMKYEIVKKQVVR